LGNTAQTNTTHTDVVVRREMCWMWKKPWWSWEKKNTTTGGHRGGHRDVRLGKKPWWRWQKKKRWKKKNTKTGGHRGVPLGGNDQVPPGPLARSPSDAAPDRCGGRIGSGTRSGVLAAKLGSDVPLRGH
jgi:hypothetical protein